MRGSERDRALAAACPLHFDSAPGGYEWFDAADFARLLRVRQSTVRRWIARGVLAGRRMGNPRSRLRVRFIDWERAFVAAVMYGDARTLRALGPKG